LKRKENLALKKTLVEEKVKVDKLTLDLSSANDSLKRISKESSLINDSFVNLKNAHSELQERHSSLEVKYKHLETNFDTLLKKTKIISKTTHDPNISTSEGCSKCYSIDIKSCVTNLVKLEEKSKQKMLKLGI
jgi:predicted nuclease with TOPRIM domain